MKLPNLNKFVAVTRKHLILSGLFMIYLGFFIGLLIFYEAKDHSLAAVTVDATMAERWCEFNGGVGIWHIGPTKDDNGYRLDFDCGVQEPVWPKAEPQGGEVVPQSHKEEHTL